MLDKQQEFPLLFPELQCPAEIRIEVHIDLAYFFGLSQTPKLRES